MSDINPIKQAPVQGMTGLSGGPASLLLTPPPPLPPAYVDEVFSTDLWFGNYNTTPAAITINNGIDVSGEGGLVWTKNRVGSNNSHQLFDTERGATKPLYSNLNNAEGSNSVFSAFNSTGFNLTAGTWGTDSLNGDSDHTFCAWTFRKQKKFFDIVTYTGNNTARNITHSLGSVPGMILLKATSAADWVVYHVSAGNQAAGALNSNAAFYTSNATIWDSTTPTATTFRVGANGNTNYPGTTYIAYIFANGATAFGDDVDQSIIKCGSWTGNGSATGPVVNLGWEPQFILFKNKDGGNNWGMHDVMRGIVNGGNDPYLMPDQSAQEDTAFDAFDISATGFQVKTDNSFWNTNGNDYIYMAIRRSDGYVSKPATAGTDVFAITSSNASASIPSFVSGFPVDFGMVKNPTYTATWYQTARLMGLKHLVSADNSAESGMSWAPMDSNKGWGISFNSSHNSWMWKRGRGFDVVTWDGTGANNTLNHSLGKTPEMIWVKARSEAQNWITYHKGLNGGTTPWNYYQLLNTDAAEANWSAWVQAPTSTQFSIISNWSASNQDYVAMLFASVDGISKVGHYTGDGTTNGSKEITLGFNPKFLMLKSTAAGDWLVYDAFRGFYFSSASAYIKLNENAYAQSFASETVRKTSTGFTLWSTDNSVNANGVDVLYYAHV